MDAKLKEQLKESGINIEFTIGRFMGNEDMYQKFLKKFLNDQSHEKLQDALEKKDFKEAFKGAHTLKGVTGNLGLDPLYQVVSELVEELRNEETVDETRVEEKKKEVDRLYEFYVDIIQAAED